MKIAETRFYNGAEKRIERLGIVMFQEILDLVTGIPLLILEEKDSNSGATVRRLLDAAFTAREGWVRTVSGDIDWRKCIQKNGTRICIGVEVQVSARSDLVMVDVMHLRDALENGSIDVGVIIVPSDKTAYFMTDRAPTFRETVNVIELRTRSAHLPLVLVAFEHDGAGPALPKRAKA